MTTIDEWKGVPYRPNENCARCKGAGFLYAANRDGTSDYSTIVPCRAPGCLHDSVRGNVPTDVIRQTFLNFTPVAGAEKAFKAAQSFAHGEAKFIWFMIYGPTGSGKTHLCNATIAVVRERGLDVRMVMAADLFSQLREAMRDNTTDHLLRRYKDVFFLAIDEYGVEYGSDWEAAKFDELMTSRFATAKPTMLITNKDIDDLPERVVSRFNDRELAKTVCNSAPDFRATKGQYQPRVKR